MKAEDYFYVYATNSGVDGKTVHIQVQRSKDLVEWEDMSDALPEGPRGRRAILGRSWEYGSYAGDRPKSGKKLLCWGSIHESIKVREQSEDGSDLKSGLEVIALVQPVF